MRARSRGPAPFAVVEEVGKKAENRSPVTTAIRELVDPEEVAHVQAEKVTW